METGKHFLFAPLDKKDCTARITWLPTKKNYSNTPR